MSNFLFSSVARDSCVASIIVIVQSLLVHCAVLSRYKADVRSHRKEQVSVQS